MVSLAACVRFLINFGIVSVWKPKRQLEYSRKPHHLTGNSRWECSQRTAFIQHGTCSPIVKRSQRSECGCDTIMTSKQIRFVVYVRVPVRIRMRFANIVLPLDVAWQRRSGPDHLYPGRILAKIENKNGSILPQCILFMHEKWHRAPMHTHRLWHISHQSERFIHFPIFKCSGSLR